MSRAVSVAPQTAHSAHSLPQHMNSHRTTQVCDVCGATDQNRAATPFVLRGQATFCGACWETLPRAAVRQVMQSVLLRGVPL